MARLEVDEKLLEQLKKAYSETEGLTYTGLVEWSIRKLLKGGNGR